MKYIYTILLVLVMLPMSALAQEQDGDQDVLQVATIERKPFVIADETGLTGFSIELWEEIASMNGWEHEFLVQTKFTDLLASVRIDEADAAIANISITADREEVMDFSSPIYNGGMLLMVSNEYSQNHLLTALADDRVQKILLGIVLLALVCSLLLAYFANRTHKQKISYGYALWKIITLGLYGKELPTLPSTRIIFSVWVMGLLFGLVAATAELTSTLVLLEQNAKIEEIKDLNGKKVGTINGSTSEAYLRKQKVDTIAYFDINNMFSAVATGKLDAVVHDAPVINHYAQNEGYGSVYVAGDLFNPENYGVALPTGSDLTEQINQSLLRLRETGRYDEIYNEWFAK